MKFFFPDSQDLIDPSFDFEAETRATFRVRQRDDLYAHELFDVPPFDGLLVSKAIVDGVSGSTGKYTLAQRHRLFRLGVREFLRADNHLGSTPLAIMGDCGAFTYKDAETPPFSPEEVVQFYDNCEFDFGLSVDHVILPFNAAWDRTFTGIDLVPDVLRQRQELTLDLASEFLKLADAQAVRFEPLGVAQGWSPNAYANSVSALQRMGYDYIALGGLVPLKTIEILQTLAAVAEVRRPTTRLHLLGVTRIAETGRFKEYGVVSFDSTSPFLQAFKDAKDNYHTVDGRYSAIRIPQVEGSPKMKRLIGSGQVKQEDARRLEFASLEALRLFDKGAKGIEDVLIPIAEYEKLHAGNEKRLVRYREVLTDKPWKECACEVCTAIGIEVIIFRGSERNKRRGFHNLAVFRQAMACAGVAF
jgi:hypothetical protein